MNCPNCKTKKPLKTKRTLAQGRECKRERFCFNCRKSIWTIELFVDDYYKEIRDLEQRVGDEEYKREKIEEKYETVGDALRMVIKPLNKK